MLKRHRYGCIEAGGTKFVLGVFDENGTVIARTVIPTTLPQETLNAAMEWFDQHAPFCGIGIASFGPCDIEKGIITNTPKRGWENTPIADIIRRRFLCPVGFDTDVGAAAQAELIHGAGTGHSSVVYITVGTGIGGAYSNINEQTKARTRPEMGHISVTRHPEDTDFDGICPFHKDCLEGLASGPAITERWGTSLSKMEYPEKAINVIGFYLGQFSVTLAATLAPSRIIFGGGVMGTKELIGTIRASASQINNGYLPTDFHQTIVRPGTGADSGLIGAYLLAKAAAL